MSYSCKKLIFFPAQMNYHLMFVNDEKNELIFFLDQTKEMTELDSKRRWSKPM